MKTFNAEQLLTMDAVMAKWCGYEVSYSREDECRGEQKPFVWYRSRLDQYWLRLPNGDNEAWQPTKDISQAMKLVERYQERHPYARFGMYAASNVQPPCVRITPPAYIGWLPLYQYPEGTGAFESGHLKVTAETLPIAICRAIQIADRATGWEDVPESEFLDWLARHFTPQENNQ